MVGLLGRLRGRKGVRGARGFKMEKIKEFIKKEIGLYFITNNKKYEGSTEYKDKTKSGIKISASIHKKVSDKVEKEFGIKSKKIKNTKLEIDLWDEKEKTAYEIVLGNGEEFWKDILKALKAHAKKLVIICRKYPDKYVRGFKSIERFHKSIEEVLEGKLKVEIEFINPK